VDVVAPAHNTGRCAAVDGPLRGLVLRHGPTLGRLTQFGLVGALGTVVNTLVFATATKNGLPSLAAAFLSMEIATGFNFALSDRTVFAGRARSPRWARMMAFFAVATAGFLVTGPLMLVLIAVSVPPVVANLLAIGALMVVRFVIADRFIWAAGRRRTVAER
jgi:dolichol-phosphate mannosyltransferase